MELGKNLLSRRELLVRGGFGLAAAIAGIAAPALAEQPTVLDLAYAGSMGSLMEGPLKAAAARDLKIELHGRAQGSNALAQLIVGGSLRPDIFIAVTPGPMLTVLRAGKAESAQPIAHTEMVIAYSPRSRFAPDLAAAAEGKKNWWEVLQQPGFRFGRTDPVTDPQGRNIIFTVMLASSLYRQPGLVEKILGPAINEKQIFTEPTVQARLQSGELDAASAYKIQPSPFHLPYIGLLKEINLSAPNLQADHPDLALSVGGKIFRPEPLIFYAAVLKDAPHGSAAAAFTEWLRGSDAQAIFRDYNYDPPGEAPALHP
ncbi:MAG TPA: extracellular solute-binding protein [Candidatus Angelobacter sp.]|nr:extracellular solute-binding protein [Candidatus Angelobacter sp.]